MSYGSPPPTAGATPASVKIDINDTAAVDHAMIARIALHKARLLKKPPKEDFAKGLVKGGHWNPMQRYPRNQFCPCGSTKKFKRCCWPKIPLAVDREHFEKYTAILQFGIANPDWNWMPNDDLSQSENNENGTDQGKIQTPSDADSAGGNETQAEGPEPAEQI